MIFSITAGLILILVIVVLAYPLWNQSAAPIPMGLEASADQERIDLEIEKQTLLNSLADLDLDLAQSRLTPSDFERLKAVDENRLGRILDRMDSLPVKSAPASPPSRSGLQSHAAMKWAGSAALSLVVIGTAAGIYGYIHGKIGLEAQKRVAEQGGVPGSQGMPNPAEMVARLEKRLQENPNDLQGQVMAGRSYMTLQRIDDARKAWSKVVELDYGNYEGHFFLGLIQIQTAPPDDPNRDGLFGDVTVLVEGDSAGDALERGVAGADPGEVVPDALPVRPNRCQGTRDQMHGVVGAGAAVIRQAIPRRPAVRLDEPPLLLGEVVECGGHGFRSILP